MPEKGTGGFLHPESVLNQIGIQSGMEIADFGCGSGYFTILLAKQTGEEGEVHAVDVLTSALEEIKSKAKMESLFNINPVRADLETPNGSKLPDNSQDLVMLANILFQSKKKENIIKEAKRVVKPDGRIIIIDWMESSNIAPREGYLISKEGIKEIAKNEGIKFEQEISAGQYHYGLIFKK